MIKEIIPYTDYNGKEQTGEYYFNLNKIELTRMEMSVKGGFSAGLEAMVKAEDGKSILEVIENFVQKSFGVKTPEGGFVKRKEDLDAFMASAAYSELVMKLVTDEEAAARFINGVVPADLAKQLAAAK